jgi:NADPH2:quinone reductase
MVIIGFASGRIPEVKGHYVLLKNISIVGAPLDIHFKMEPKVMDAAVADLFRMYEKAQRGLRRAAFGIRSLRQQPD